MLNLSRDLGEAVIFRLRSDEERGRAEASQMLLTVVEFGHHQARLHLEAKGVDEHGILFHDRPLMVAFNDRRVVIHVSRVNRNQARFQFDAPREVRIYRAEKLPPVQQQSRPKP